jgi:hypothetical protein
MANVVLMMAAAMCATQSLPSSSLRLSVPERVAAYPILALEGVEIGAGEGWTLEVYDEARREIFAITGLVGERQSKLAEPRERLTMMVPLNEKASRAMAGKKEITLTLVLRDSPGREALKIDRAYFAAAGGD